MDELMVSVPLKRYEELIRNEMKLRILLEEPGAQIDCGGGKYITGSDLMNMFGLKEDKK